LQLDGQVVEEPQTPIVAKAFAAKGVHNNRVSGGMPWNPMPEQPFEIATTTLPLPHLLYHQIVHVALSAASARHCDRGQDSEISCEPRPLEAKSCTQLVR